MNELHGTNLTSSEQAHAMRTEDKSKMKTPTNEVLKEYRQFAVEFGKGKELEDDYKK